MSELDRLNQTSESERTLQCPNCATMIAPGLLSCPGCHGLVYSGRLKQLAKEAEEAKQAGNLLQSLELYREALMLLPENTMQYRAIAEKVDALSRQVDQGIDGHDSPDGKRTVKGIPSKLAGLGTLGLLLWKFKFVFAFLLTKGKILLLGLTKAQTVVTMLLAFGVYLTIWGWRFALGIILSIYVHEMGHVAALRTFGINCSAPAFIPGFGAFVRMKQGTINAIENARVGLAGPVWGFCAAAICYGIFLFTGSEIFGALAKVGAWINLFNLLPIMPLDGGRGFSVLNSTQRWIAAGVIAVMWFLTSEGLLVLLLLVAIVSALTRKAADSQIEDWRALIEYSALVVLLSLMCAIEVRL